MCFGGYSGDCYSGSSIVGRRCSERKMQSPDFIGLLGVLQAWGARRLGVLFCRFFRPSESSREDGFWVHN